MALPSQILLDPTLILNVTGTKVRYALRGVIYSGSNHFTWRIVAENGECWYHDGIETGTTSEPEGCIHDKPVTFLLKCIRPDISRNAAGVLYAIVD
ncbi:hypothetical protein B0H13DRAFT_2028711, partial [Mycena leptocephala]